VSTSSRKLRLRGLAVATTLALGATSALAAQVDTAGLEPGQQYDRFIVKFRDNAPEATDASALRRSRPMSFPVGLEKLGTV